MVATVLVIGVAIALSFSALASAAERPPPGTPDATVIQVAGSGSDGGTGSAGSPLRTINAALARAHGGDIIEVSRGEYPAVRWTAPFDSPVTIRGNGRPTITASAGEDSEAIALWGAQNLIFEGFEIHGALARVTDHPLLKSSQVSEHITFRNNEFVGVNGSGTGVNIRSGSKDITVEGNFIHDLTSGITCGNYRVIDGVDTGAPLVDGVVVRGNRFENFKQDAMQFADWENVVIDENVMQHSKHDPKPAPQYHNDLIQFTGYSRHVRITRNYLSDSAQEIFIQPMFGPIDDVVVENNLLAGARDYAVQSQAVTGLRFVNNTLWDSHYGMAIRGGPKLEPPATDGVVIGNIINRLSYPPGTHEEYNLIGEPAKRPTGYGPHDLLSTDPLFKGSGDYTLEPSSPAADAGHPQIFPSVDLPGIARSSPPSMGAYEIAVESHGTPSPPGGESTSLNEDTSEDRAGRAERNLMIALRLPGHGRVTVRRDVFVPNVCDGDCRIIVTGEVAVFVGSKPATRHTMRLLPSQVRLSQMLTHGIRLTTKGLGTLGRAQIGGPIHALARVVLRFAPGSPDEARRHLLVKFGPGNGASGAGPATDLRWFSQARPAPLR